MAKIKIKNGPFYLGQKEKDLTLKEAISALNNKEFDKAIEIIDLNSNFLSDEFHDTRSLIGQIKLISGITQKHQAYLKMAEHEIKRAKSRWLSGSKEEHITVAKNYLEEAQRLASRCNAQIRGVMISFKKLKVDASKVIK
ncbi:hypothetical protein HN385_05425 [archaeon]|jgi:hypothetical protein|nr:hypothetical protein [archaeon]MBT3450953.1 hypothetical protein [archaeon]MBT6869476.1 hypothetical protein [archaeon]MBT7193164.1 hypothetical protein [archaeon]MBT7380470.1 hypothetical protein [archaeon]